MLEKVGILLFGLFIGFVVGEMLEERKDIKIVATVLAGFFDLLIVKIEQEWLAYIGYGLFIGLLISIFTEPGPLRYCYRCLTKK